MKRRIVMLLVFLLLGAIVNIAVAWGCALFVSTSWSHEVLRGSMRWHADDRVWDVHLMKRSGAAQLFTSSTYSSQYQRMLKANPQAGIYMGGSIVTLEAIPPWSRFHKPLNKIDRDMPFTVWHEYAYGWPLLSMTYRFGNFHQVGGKAVTPPGLPHSKEFAYVEIGARRLPSGIHVPAFVINTLFYAAILWLLFAGPFALRGARRWRRIKRGLCPACAYPVGTSDLCTECGRPVPSPLRGRARVGVERTSTDAAPNDTASSTHPLTPSLRGRGDQRPASS